MTAHTPVYGLEYIVEGEPVRNARAALENNALTIEAALIAGGIAPAGAPDIATLSGRVSTLENGLWTSYNPTWQSSGGAPAIGNGILTGRYRKSGRSVDLHIYVEFGSTTSGGSGEWRFQLPFATVAGREQQFTVKAFTAAPGLDFAGVAFVAPSSSTVFPQLPRCSGTNPFSLAQVRNADLTNATGTGVPQAPGAFSFSPGHRLAIFGRYEAAS